MNSTLFRVLAVCGLTAMVSTAGISQSPAAQPYSWHSVAIVAGGFISGIDFNPAAKDCLYARTDIGGAYRWDHTVGRWIPLLDWVSPADWTLTGVESIGVDPADASRVYLAVGMYTNSWSGNGAILRSQDQGRTWKRTDLPFKNGSNEDGRSMGERLAVDPNDDSIVYFGTRNNGLWRSGDYGATWSQVQTFPVLGRTDGGGVAGMFFDGSSGKHGAATPVVYACVCQDGPGLYKSVDAGVHWEPVVGQPGVGLLPHHALLTPGGILYVSYTNALGPNGVSAGAVWKLDTKSGVWTDISPIKTGNPNASGYAGLAVDAEHPETVMVATIDRWNPGDTIFRTKDGGSTWTDIGPKSLRDSSLSPYLNYGSPMAKLGHWIGALAIDPFRPAHVLYGTGATLWATNDATQTDSDLPTHWTVGAAGIEETAVRALISPPSGVHLISGVGDICGFLHDDFTVSAPDGMMVPTMSSTSGIDFAAATPNVIVRVGSTVDRKNGAISDNGGATWTLFVSQPSGTRDGGSTAVSADGKTVVWSPNGARTSVSQDSGKSWTPCTGAPGNVQVVADRVDPTRFYAFDSRQGVLYVSTNGGTSFVVQAKGLASGGGISAVPGIPGDLWLSSGAGIFHSTDAGATFTKLASAENGKELGFGKAAPGRTYPALYLAGSVDGLSGIFRSDNAGDSWVRINDDAHQYGGASLICGDPRVYGRVYIGTNGRGVLYADPARP